MQATSTLYKKILQDRTHTKEVKAVIAGVEYLHDRLISVSTEACLLGTNGPGIGFAVSRQIDMEFYPDDDKIPDAARIELYVRLCSGTMQAVKVIDVSNFDTTKVSNMSGIFDYCSVLEEILGFSACYGSGMSIGFPRGSQYGGTCHLRRLTFRTDLPDGQYSIRSAINIGYCSFERSGIVEMFGTLPDISSLGLSASYKKITITKNPCVTGKLADGTACDTITDADRAIATTKGWTLVE